MDNYPGAACIGWADNATCQLTLRNKDGKEGSVLLQDEYQYESGKDAGKKIEACISNFDKVSAEPVTSYRWGTLLLVPRITLGNLCLADKINEPVANYLRRGINEIRCCFIDFIDKRGDEISGYLIGSIYN